MFTVVVGVVAALVFGIAGWLGALLSQVLYGTLVPLDAAPATLEVPSWTFAVVAACIGFCISLQHQEPAYVAILLISVLAITVCAATDFRSGLIPDLFSLGPLPLILAFSAVQRDWTPLLGALIVGVPFAATAAFTRGRGMGWGDVKLAVLGGSLLGMTGITLAVALASLCAYLVARTIGRLHQPIAFGPYLAASIGAALAVGSR